MNLSIQVSGQHPNEARVAMRQFDVGYNSDTPESRLLHKHICNLIEPAIYEAVRVIVANGVLQTAIVVWDGETIRIRSK